MNEICIYFWIDNVWAEVAESSTDARLKDRLSINKNIEIASKDSKTDPFQMVIHPTNQDLLGWKSTQIVKRFAFF